MNFGNFTKLTIVRNLNFVKNFKILIQNLSKISKFLFTPESSSTRTARLPWVVASREFPSITGVDKTKCDKSAMKTTNHDKNIVESPEEIEKSRLRVAKLLQILQDVGFILDSYSGIPDGRQAKILPTVGPDAPLVLRIFFKILVIWANFGDFWWFWYRLQNFGKSL